VKDPQALQNALNGYASLIRPWATSVAAAMLADVNARTERMWKQLSAELGQELGKEIATAPTGQRMQELMSEQVNLITSLPTSAAQRVHDLTMAAIVDGTRAEQVAKEILDTTNVTTSRARLIARTEVARTASVLTQARAEYAGSEGYIWRTSGDADVRDSHAEMEGKYVRWSQAPLLSDGTRTHAGQIYNCRCFAEPIFPDY
jgi:SPP1 gp7 family putative phage head morphogenesis protein